MEPETLALIEAARASWHRRVTAPDYGEPKPYVPKERPRPSKPKPKWPPTLDQADAMDAEYENYHKRAGAPVTAAGLVRLWEEFYAFAFAAGKDSNPLPVQDYVARQFGATQWHDIFGKAKMVCERSGHRNGPPPFRLIDELVLQEDRRRDRLEARRKRIAVARAQGILRKRPDDDELPSSYPRVYLVQTWPGQGTTRW